MNKETKKRIIIILTLVIVTIIYVTFTNDINRIIKNLLSYALIINPQIILDIIIIILLIKIYNKVKKNQQ